MARGLPNLAFGHTLRIWSGIPNLEDVVTDSQLNVIIAWRIATYHVPLVITWIAHEDLLHRVSAPNIRQPVTGTEDKKPENDGKQHYTIGELALKKEHMRFSLQDNSYHRRFLWHYNASCFVFAKIRFAYFIHSSIKGIVRKIISFTKQN